MKRPQKIISQIMDKNAKQEAEMTKLNTIISSMRGGRDHFELGSCSSVADDLVVKLYT